MIQLLSLINIVLLFVGIYYLVTKFSVEASGAINKLTAIVILLISLSFLYYLILVLNQGYVFLLVTMCVINLAHIYYTRHIINDFFKRENTAADRRYGIIIPAAILLLTIFFVLRGPKYGGYDAWAIWNMHAKFLYDTHGWKRMLVKELAYSHPDYPMMLPGLVAFFWKSAGQITLVVPVLLSYSVLLLVPVSVYYPLRDKKLTGFAIIALAIFIIDNNFKLVMLAQQADSLMALLMLFTFIQYQQVKDNGQAYLLGFICASCGWVKNEGLVFYTLFTICFLIANFKNLKAVRRYLVGAILPTLVIMSYKLFFSPQNDLVSAGTAHLSIPATVLNPARYSVIVKYWVNLLIDSFMVTVALIGLLLIFNRRFFISLPFIVILLLLLSYIAVYLTTVYDVEWLMANSLNRLLMQIFPSFVFLALLGLQDLYKQSSLKNSEI